ncbi:MAG TPA: hypothetical protein GX717_04955, partial [Clostridiaceae bacterium]|nr:hypothetical protein [Clostridiaceae bacterium]
EWENVIAAMRYLYNATGSADVVLYGIGCGVTTAISTWEHLPEAYSIDNENTSPAVADPVTEAIPNDALSRLAFRRDAIKGFIFDSPLPESDEYIRFTVRERNFFLHSITQYTVPYAIRLTAGLVKNINVKQMVTDLPVPLLIIQQETYGDLDAPLTLAVSEARLKETHGMTDIFTSAATEPYSSYADDAERYLDIVGNYLDKLVYSIE